MRVTRGPKFPADARASMGISDRERVIAWGVGDREQREASFVVATDQALYEQRTITRIGWREVIKGTWEQPDLVIDFHSEVGPRRIRIRLDGPRDVPAAVRDRVTDTVVVSEYRELSSGIGAHFVARRSPGGGVDQIQWSVVFDAGSDPSEPDLRSRADQVLAELRASLGV